jgi:hypothetical protein
MDDAEKRKFLTLPGLELPPLGGPAGSQSLSKLQKYYYPKQNHVLKANTQSFAMELFQNLAEDKFNTLTA